MTLFEGEKNHAYEVTGIYLEDTLARRLHALGLNDKTKIQILSRKKNGALILHVRGTRLALGKYLTTGIEVKEARDEG